MHSFPMLYGISCLSFESIMFHPSEPADAALSPSTCACPGNFLTDIRVPSDYRGSAESDVDAGEVGLEKAIDSPISSSVFDASSRTEGPFMPAQGFVALS
jgi:hypothetical protein